MVEQNKPNKASEENVEIDASDIAQAVVDEESEEPQQEQVNE